MSLVWLLSFPSSKPPTTTSRAILQVFHAYMCTSKSDNVFSTCSTTKNRLALSFLSFSPCSGKSSHSPSTFFSRRPLDHHRATITKMYSTFTIRRHTLYQLFGFDSKFNLSQESHSSLCSIELGCIFTTKHSTTHYSLY